MKKLAIYTGLALMVAFTACDKKFSELEVSPNSPAKVTPAVLLTNCEVATFQQFTANTARVLSIWTNQGAGCDFQYVDLGNYVYNEQDVVNDWSNLYSNNLINLKQIITQTEGTSPHYSGIAKILMGMNYGLATDLWGDIPMSKALNGLDGQFTSAYDAQEDVLVAVIQLFDDGIADLNQAESAQFPGGDDLIFGGDLDMWKKTAYALKARYAMRYSKRDATKAASDALAAIPNAISANSENMLAIFGTANNNANQWYAFINNRGGYYQIRDSFVDMFYDAGSATVTDARGPFYFTTADQTPDFYRGAAGGSPDPQASTVGDLFASINSSLPMVTYFEVKFIEAEATLMQGSDASAALSAAVDASFEYVTGAADPTYTANVMANYAAADNAGKMEIIMTEKYKAMFTQPEVFSDWRRTDIPALTPQPGANLAAIPRRWPASQAERLYNTEATNLITNLLTPVWWDN